MSGIEIIKSAVLFFSYFQWAIIIVYFFIIILAWYGWVKKELTKKTVSSRDIFVSVIVAARNEDVNLPGLLNDLKTQTYPSELTEWIFVDDHSLNRIAKLQEFSTNLHKDLVIIELGANEKGKKTAQINAAQNSKGELLIFTDADCRLKPQWIASIVNKFAHSKQSMIIGLVDYHQQKGFWQQFYRFDLISLVISGAGLASMGFPIMCNGANLAIRKDSFLKNIHGLKSEIASGDDVFMLHSIKKNNTERVSVLKSKDSVVITQPPSNLNEFLNQRTRWASKSWLYTDIFIISTAVVVFLANLILLASLFTSLMSGNFVGLIYLFLIKTIADCFIITAGLNFFGGKRNLLLFPIFSLVYPFYFFIVFILSLKGSYTWKGRYITKA